MIILKREPIKRKKGYYEITVEPLDDEEARAFEEKFGLGSTYQLEVSEEVLFRRSLNVNDRIALQELKQLMDQDERVKARDAALKLLDYRMRTVKEVEEKLKEKGFSSQTIEETVSTLEEYRFLDDVTYAKDYLKGRIAQRGIRVIEQELSRKGVDKEITRELSEDLEDEEYEAALFACRKKYRNLSSRESDSRRLKEKVYRFLMSRGYNYDLIKKVYEETAENSDPDEEWTDF